MRKSLIAFFILALLGDFAFCEETPSSASKTQPTSAPAEVEKNFERLTKEFDDFGNKMRYLDASLEGKSEKTLVKAAALGEFEEVLELLELGMSVNARDEEMELSALDAAIINKHRQIVDLLLEHKVRVNTKGKFNMTPLMYAVLSGDSKTVRLLIERKADTSAKNSFGQTALNLAETKKRKKIAKLLRSHSDAQSSTGEQSIKTISQAVKAGKLERVKAFVSIGADIKEPQNSFGETLLMSAAVAGHLKIVRYLIRQGAKVNATTSFGQTALHFAAEAGQASVVRLLLKNNANLHQFTDLGVSPLMAAASNGHAASVKALVEAGSQLSARDQNGNSALSLAKRAGHDEVVRLLVKAGAE